MGLSTYDSCYRAGAVFGVRSAVVVTQGYHLPRAVYTCRSLGIDAEGLAVADGEAYDTGVMLPYAAREALATTRSLWQLHATRPAPRFLGPREALPASR